MDLSARPNYHDQAEVNARLKQDDDMDKARIAVGELRPAPAFPSEHVTEEELKEARERKRLLYLNLEFTRLCNLGCVGCFNYFEDVFRDFSDEQTHGPSDQRGDLLAHEQILDVMTQAARFGAKSVDLMGGGEPLAYKRFFDLVDHARVLGMQVETFTNGTLITEAVAKRMFESGVTPYVKVYSLDPALHDRMVNRKGAHAMVMRGIERLKAAGYGSDGAPAMAIETIVIDSNIEELPDLWRFARNQGFLPYFERFVGCGYDGDSTRLPSPGRLKQLWEDIREIDRDEYGYTFPLLPLRIGYACGSPFYSVYVQCDGMVRPCSGTWAELGNVKETPLSEIVRNSPVLKQLRDYKDGPGGWCAGCYYQSEYACAGCRGQSTLLNGGIASDDPLCFHNPANLERPHGGSIEP